MKKRSEAQRAAEARYDGKRHGEAVTMRLTRAQAEWLDARRGPGESRPATVRRLAQIPGWCNPGVKMPVARVIYASGNRAG